MEYTAPPADAIFVYADPKLFDVLIGNATTRPAAATLLPCSTDSDAPCLLYYQPGADGTAIGWELPLQHRPVSGQLVAALMADDTPDDVCYEEDELMHEDSADAVAEKKPAEQDRGRGRSSGRESDSDDPRDRHTRAPVAYDPGPRRPILHVTSNHMLSHDNRYVRGW